MEPVLDQVRTTTQEVVANGMIFSAISIMLLQHSSKTLPGRESGVFASCLGASWPLVGALVCCCSNDHQLLDQRVLTPLLVMLGISVRRSKIK